MVQSLFEEHEVERNLNMVAPYVRETDEKIWNGSQGEYYTVRSTYRVITNFFTNEAILRVLGERMKLWRIDVPSKLKHLIWRIARHVLSMLEALRGRRVNVGTECGLCNQRDELLDHLLHECKVAKKCWNLAGVDHRVEVAWKNTSTVEEWLFDLITNVARHGPHKRVVASGTTRSPCSSISFDEQVCKVASSTIGLRQVLMEDEVPLGEVEEMIYKVDLELEEKRLNYSQKLELRKKKGIAWNCRHHPLDNMLIMYSPDSQ
ncbi:hypothetical protein LINPERPRIM_LOCUS27876 [Linum perenne]